MFGFLQKVSPGKKTTETPEFIKRNGSSRRKLKLHPLLGKKNELSFLRIVINDYQILAMLEVSISTQFL